MSQLNRHSSGAQSNPGAVAADATARQVVGLKQQRVSLSLRNNGLTTLFFGFSAALTTANGYPLYSQEEYEFVDYVGPVFIICATSGDLRFYEVF